MTADLVARLDYARRALDADGDEHNVCPILREAASALRSSGEAVGFVDGSRLHTLKEGRLNLALWSERGSNADTPLYLHPATPATVTDEDVERAARAYWNAGNRGFSPSWDEMAKGDAGWAASVNVCMRAALESFVRPTPPTSTKGG